jgi:hypothetical protein
MSKSFNPTLFLLMPALKTALILLAALTLAASNYAVAQETSNATSVPKSGIRNVLKMAVKSDADSRFSQQNPRDAETATLIVKVRISAHSQETNFYGDVPTTVSDFDPAKGSNEQEVWRDSQCHHERGFPKTSVIDVEGTIASGQKKLPISARYRWIGLLLPEDEIMPAKRLDGGSDNFGPFIATRTETKLSRLLIDLKLYILPCSLAVGAN